MKSVRRVLFVLIACLTMMLPSVLGVSANSGGLPSAWGANGDLQAGPLGLTKTGSHGEIPVSISIPDAGVDAEIEKSKIVDGQMLDPSGPWVVSWYQETGKAGDTIDRRNMVLAGHVDYWDVGPAVFQSVASLSDGATITVNGENGEVYTYAVTKVYQVPAQPSEKELRDIVEPKDTKETMLTIITCGGVFNYDKGEYESRTIVRAKLVDVNSN